MGTPAGSLHPSLRARICGLALVALAVLCAAPARAQHGFVPPDDRVLHERLAGARIVAVATVAEVDTGRIAFESGRSILGRIEPEFEVKRSPSNPPPWVPGDRALLMLSGARSPYRWVEKPVETVALADAAAEARFTAAVRAMDAARVDAKGRRDLYARWADGMHEDLAAVGQRGLMDVPSMVNLLDVEFVTGRVGVAIDPERPVVARRRAARIAARHPDGVSALLRHVEDEGPATDPGVGELAIQSGLLLRDPAVEARIIDLLDTPETELGGIALRLAGAAGGRALERKLSELAVGYPDETIRGEAAQSLRNLRKRSASRGG
ncbi:MAG: hypothetical protein JRH10_02170 [Deltaproteobacteria bacterium]|nr:hypothetical protein [Deltaproteobacteria bacterium]MBW2445431.1 hypothetical protein [Deltaproteobacteria bacterium]